MLTKKSDMRTLICGLIASVAGVAGATTYTAKSVSGGTDTLTSGTYWSGGIAPSDASAAGHDFVCTLSGSGNGIRTPGNTTFLCNSLTFGEMNKQVDFYFKEGDWTFPTTSKGLVFVRARMADWTAGTKAYAFNGPVTFSDEFSKSAAGRYACEFWGDKDSANAVVHDFTGKVTAPEKAVIKNYLKSPTGGRHYGMRFGGDLTDFEGEMVMGESARLEIGATAMPGTITASGANVIVAPVAGTAGFSVGTLTMADGTTIEAALNRDTGACQPITVTKKLTAGALTVRILAETYTAGTSVPERKYAILRFPAEGATFDADSVTFVSDTVNLDDLVPSTETDEGVTTLYLTHAATLPIVSRVAGGSEQFLEYASTWSDEQVPHGGAQYLSVGSVAGTFRLWAAKYPYVFPAPLLTIQGGAVVEQCNDITISNMLITADVNLCNWHAASKVPGSLSTNGIRYCRGNISLAGGSATVQTIVPVHLVFDGDISGSHRFNVCQNQGSGTMESPFYCELRGNNTFSDILNVWTKYATSFDTGLVLCFREGRNLGGNPASFVYNANNLGAYVTCRALGSTTLDTMNRGICVAGSAFDTPEGVTLAIKQRVRYMGDLTKFGAGTLVLDGDRDIVNCTPTLHVKDGFLKVAKPAACNGVALAFTGDAGLKVALEDPAAPGQGIAGTSLAVNTDDGLLHVTIDAETLPKNGCAPICTVSKTAAAALRGKFKVEKPAQGFWATVVERAVDANTVTFCAEVHGAGMSVYVR